MTIDKNNVVKIPVWLIAVILPLILSILTAIIVLNTSAAATQKQVEINTEEIKQKVNQSEFEIIREQLNRIEKKVDYYVEKREQ